MNKLTHKHIKNQEGQVLLLTILVTVIVLTLAVAAARRTTIDIRQLNAATESNRALTAAEAGVEDVLLSLKNGDLPVDCGLPTPACDVVLAGSEVSAVDVETQNSLALSDLPEEQTVQVLLSDGIIDFNGNLEIIWETGSAIVLTVILQDNSTPPQYELYRKTYNCGSVSSNNNFDNVVDDDGDGFCKINNFNIQSIENQFPGFNAISVRIRPMYENTFLSVSAVGGGVGNELPTQAFTVVSTGTSGDSERTIQATRTNEAMPAIFDFVLFNGSTTNSLTNITNGTSWFQFFNGDIHSAAGGGIDVDVPAGSSLCHPDGACVFTSSGNINAGSGDLSDEGWQQSNYGGEFSIEEYTYDAFLSNLSEEVLAVGANLDNVSSTLSTCGVSVPNCIVRLTGTGAPATAVINNSNKDYLSTKPVVVFVGNNVGDEDVNLNIDVAELVGKNVVFIVSGDVVLTSAVNKVEAAVIFDGLYTVRD